MSVDSPLKWHGGKSYLASRIVAMMPPHVCYVEPFFGGGSVLLHKDPEGVSEVANDLDADLYTFWKVLANPKAFELFSRLAEATPFAEAVWDEAANDPAAPAGVWPDYPAEVSRAFRFFVRCRQSMAGRRKNFAPLSRNRTRRGMNEQASAWLSAVDGLPEVHARLRRVAWLNRDAADVMRQHDGPNTLHYLDPPYVHATRATTGEYAHEMDEAAHRRLLETANQCVGMVMVSGYESALYPEKLPGPKWRRTDFDLPNNAAGGESKRRMIECVWTNFDPVA